jgi:hypothetical protein
VRRRVVLVAEVERLHGPPRQQLHLVPQPLELPRPVANFHPDQARRAIDKVLQKPGATERLAHDLSCLLYLRNALEKRSLQGRSQLAQASWRTPSGLPVKTSMVLQICHFDAVGP